MFCILTGSGLLSASSLPATKSGYKGIIIFLIPFITFILFIFNNPQSKEYWQNSVAGKTKIYSITFSDNFNGKAITPTGETFISFDGGETWQINKYMYEKYESEVVTVSWSADIFCSVMMTTDGGITWLPYDKKEQEHFCSVYLKDQNTGYQIAGSFLSQVTRKIFNYLNDDEINLLIDNPQQCTEYYSNENNGWALGWCLKNFNQAQSQ